MGDDADEVFAQIMKDRERSANRKGRLISVILDTDALIALLNGEPAANETIRHLEEKGNQFATTIISAYELLRGAYISSKPERNLAEAHELLSNIEILDLTMQAAEEASKIYL